MTVRDAVHVLADAKALYIAWCGGISPLDPENALMMDAFGAYKVCSIRTSHEQGSFEIEIAAMPAKEEV